MNKNLDYIAATHYIVKSLLEPVETQEEAKQSWIMTYHFIKQILEEDEKAK